MSIAHLWPISTVQPSLGDNLPEPGRVHVVVIRITLAAALAGALSLSAFGADDKALEKLLKGVEKRYNGAVTLRVRFEQTYSVPSRGHRTEWGNLFLRKPGRMRWEYADPAGKLFVSDGKNVFFYSPSTNRVEKSKLKETDDFRAPLAFLLGKLDFSRDFRNFQTRATAEGTWITADPKSERLPYRKVEFLVSPQEEIRHIIITDLQNGRLEFRFGDELRNPALSDSLFRFKVPPGAEFVEVSELQER